MTTYIADYDLRGRETERPFLRPYPVRLLRRDALPDQTRGGTSMTWRVEDLQAVEPEALPKRRGVTVVLGTEYDGQGFKRADIEAETREQLLDYVREGWGDDDEVWFREYVEDRAFEVTSPRTILVHLNVGVPYDSTLTASDVEKAAQGILEVGREGLDDAYDATQWTVALTEEV